AIAAPIRGAGPTSPLPSLRLRNFVGQAAQLPLIDHGTIDHADQNLLDRSVAKQIDDPLDRLGGNLPAGMGRLVNVGPPIDGVTDVTLLLQSPQHGANRRFLQTPPQSLAYKFCRERAAGPDQLHHFALEVAQVRHVFASHVSLVCGSIGATLQIVAQAASPRQFLVRPDLGGALLAGLNGISRSASDRSRHFAAPQYFGRYPNL